MGGGLVDRRLGDGDPLVMFSQATQHLAILRQGQRRWLQECGLNAARQRCDQEVAYVSSGPDSTVSVSF